MLQNLALPAPQQSSKCLFKVFCGNIWYKVEGQLRPETLDNDTQLTDHTQSLGTAQTAAGRKEGDGMLTGLQALAELKTKTIFSLNIWL